MGRLLRTFSFSLIWLASNSVGWCQQTESSLGSTSGTAPGESSQPSSAARTLDDIRNELKKKNMGMEPGMSSSMGMGPGTMGGGLGVGPKQMLTQWIQQLRGRLGSKDSNREKVEKQLKLALQQYFILDMEERVKEFDKVRARVAEMENKLQRRLDNEGEIVELQLKQMLHKADGLDFSVPGGNGLGSGGGEGYGGAGMGGPGMGAGGGYGGEGGYGGYGGGGMVAPPGGMGGPGMGMGEGMGGEGGFGAAGMDEGGAEYGTGMGVGVDPAMIGYDASFGMTQFQRIDTSDLEDSDPLKTYAQLNPVSRRADSASTDIEKLNEILLAFHQFEARFHHFPKSASRQTKSQPPHSWRVAILPLIGYGELYQEYQFDQPWDSQQNLQVAKKMPELFRTTQARTNVTTFKMIVGGGGLDSSNTPCRMSDITDGTSNTIAVIHADDVVPWTKPEDFDYSTTGPVPTLSKSRLVGLADGVAIELPASLSVPDFRALLTRSGGEVVNLSYGRR